MKTYKRYIQILLALAFPISLFAQQKVITLSEPQTANGATVYEAQQTIYLNPGFSYTANGTSTFTAKINEAMVIPNEYVTPVTVNTRTLSTGMSIGTIAGGASVGPSGAANYQMNLTLPPGINGVQPNISLVYNSQGGNGVAGWGFNIAGLSAVSRAPRTIYSDGTAAGLLATVNAKYVLDGVSLIPVTGTNGSDGTEYRMETENFSKIYSRGNFNNTGPDWFEVKTKDGMILKYGNLTGKFKATSATNASYVTAWYLNRMENQDGVGVDYEYEAAGMGLYLKKITYSGNTVEFFYNSRKDTIQVYAGAKTGFQDRILRKITVTCEGSVFRTYELEYAFDQFSRLIRVTEGNELGEKKNPTLFEWGSFPVKTNINVKDVAVAIPSLKPDFSKQFFARADLNGDGLTDFIALSTDIEGNRTVGTGCRVHKFIAKKDGNNIKFEIGNDDGLPPPGDWEKFLRKYGGFYNGDFMGAGIQNVMIPIYNKSTDERALKFYIFQDSSTYSLFQDLGPISANSIIINLIYSMELPEIAVGDVDNDGRTEILYIEKGSSVLKIGGYEKIPFTSYTLSITGSPERMFVEDFNGDGMKDVMVVTQGGYQIYWNQGGAFSAMFSSNNKTVGTLFNSSYSDIEIGDFNGDGLPDFVLNEHCNDKWHLALNQGNGIFSDKALPQIKAVEEDFTGLNDEQDRCFVADFDGDGKSDLIVNDSEYTPDKLLWVFDNGGNFSTHHVYWYRSTGNDFELVKPATTYNKEDAKNQYYIFGDFKGTGNFQMLFFGYDCYNGQDMTQKWRLYDNAGLTVESGKIKGISDGLNNQTKFTYKSLTDTTISHNQLSYRGKWDGRGTFEVNSTYPIVTLIAPLALVSDMKQTNGVVPDTIVNSYTYKNGRIHLQGKGFLGFEQVRMANPLTKTTQVQDFGKLDSTYYYPLSSMTTILVNTDTLSTSYTTNKVKALWGKRIFLYSDSTLGKDFLNGTTSSSIQAYDNDGNMTKGTVNYGSDVTEVTDAVYGHYGGNGIANKPTSVTLTRTYGKKAAFASKQFYGYDAKGHLTQKTQFANTTAPLITDYLNFNSLGLPAKMRDSSKTEVRETSFGYDSRGRVTSQTNAVGQVFKSAYDALGRLSMETDPLDLNTVYTYDGWDRKTQIEYPDNTTETKQWAWAGSGGDNPNKSLYYTTSTASGKANILSYYDATGRELRTITYDAFNRKVYNDRKYNAKGQADSTSLPYFSTDAVQWIVNKYDDYGRKTSENNLGRTTNYGYGKLTTTVTTPDNRKTTKTTNAKGDVVMVEEVGRNGLIQYSYHSSGQPDSVKANGSLFTMEYDAYGRQNKLKDPNAGTIQYTYNPFGELVTQIDARNYTTTFKYDAIGREKERIVSGGGKADTTLTAYNKYGIDSVKTGNKAVSYKYDSYGRVQSMTERAGTTGYTTGYTYDANGNLQTLIFPSGFAVQYGYVNGMTTSIKKASNQGAIWDLTGVNALGQITSYKNGGKFAVDLGYDAYYNPTTKKLDAVSYAAQTVNQLTGNLTNRSVGTSTESFGYDSQYRLTSWYGGAATFDDNGNIKTKTASGKTGTYSYDPLRPHAVSGVTEPIVSLKQDITYNGAGRAISITEGDGAYRLALEYGVDDQRVKTFLYQNDSLIKEKHFASNYEKVITGQTVREIAYIAAPSGLTAILIRSGGIDSLFYVYTDLQGSILQLNDETGKIVEQRVYDPWGRERDPQNWNNYLTDVGYRRTDRGYIGQEHLLQFGLINLNARLYDPVLGRFLSPDPFVQSPFDTQNFNRYSYAMNNPLKYTDPNGEFLWIPFVFMILSNAYIQGEHAQMNGGSFWGGFAQGAVIGAASAGLTYGVGELLGHATGSVGTELVRAGAHGLVGGGISVVQGGNFWQGFGISSISSLAGSGMKAVGWGGNYLPFATGAVGAGTAWALGGDPMSGFGQGYEIGALNHNGPGIPKNHKHADLPEVVITPRGRDFSLAAMYWHFQFGGRKPMYIRGSSLNFSNTSQRELGIAGWPVSYQGEVNLFNAGPLDPKALAFGRVKMESLGNNQFSILSGPNDGLRFDFDPLWDPSASLGRNIGNVTGLAVNSNVWSLALPLSPSMKIAMMATPWIAGGPYDVHIVGNVYIPY